MYNLVRGPFVWIAFLVFFVGTLFRIVQFFLLTQKKISVSTTNPRRHAWNPAAFKAAIQNGAFGAYPFASILSVIFHVILFAAPLFSLAHGILLDESWGIRLPALSERAVDMLTFVFLLLIVVRLLRRLLVPSIRAISTAHDYLVLLIVAMPFLTGFFAYHQWINYDAMLILHILSGELMLVLIPFTKLTHMLFFFIARFTLGGEYGFGVGSRRW